MQALEGAQSGVIPTAIKIQYDPKQYEGVVSDLVIGCHVSLKWIE
jgi:hypothetical protein